MWGSVRFLLTKNLNEIVFFSIFDAIDNWQWQISFQRSSVYNLADTDGIELFVKDPGEDMWRIGAYYIAHIQYLPLKAVIYVELCCGRGSSTTL